MINQSAAIPVLKFNKALRLHQRSWNVSWSTKKQPLAILWLLYRTSTNANGKGREGVLLYPRINSIASRSMSFLLEVPPLQCIMALSWIVLLQYLAANVSPKRAFPLWLSLYKSLGLRATEKIDSVIGTLRPD